MENYVMGFGVLILLSLFGGVIADARQRNYGGFVVLCLLSFIGLMVLLVIAPTYLNAYHG